MEYKEINNYEGLMDIIGNIKTENMIEKKFIHYCNAPSDINEHLPTLLKYGKECEHITEMGVRDVVSTWAWLMAKPKRLCCYDIIRSDNIDLALTAANSDSDKFLNKTPNIDMEFYEEDVLKVEIEETDLLFIDTLHTYSQLKKELELHASKVRKYIIFHDIVTYGSTPEPSHFKTHKGIVLQHEKILANYIPNDKGIIPAINEFLESHPEWSEKEICLNNNGLLIIAKNG